MNKLVNFIRNYYSWIIWLVATMILSYFIVHNAQWLIGDDAIIIKKTGSGQAFSIFDTINPEAGRFYPLAYYAYNILLLFNKGQISVEQHYILVSIGFFIFSFFIFKLSKDILSSFSLKKNVIDLISLLFSFMIIQRAYTTFSHVFSTIWFDYLLLIVFIFYTYQFLKTQKTYQAIISLLAILYCVFCIENIFILPISFGFLLLLFNFKHLSKKEKVFSYSLIAVGLFFLIIYYFVVYRHIIQAYDGSHGAGLSLVENAIDMMLSQKLIIVAVIVYVFRLYMITAKNEKYNKFYDTMFLTGFAYTLGCFVLKLNWGMYYMISVLYTGFPVLYFLHKYINPKYAAIIIVLISAFYIRNFPKNIKTVQTNRFETKSLIKTLEKYKNKNYEFVWRDEVFTSNNWDKTLSDWKKESLSTVLSHEFRDKDFKFQKESVAANILFFFPEEYKKYSLQFINEENIISQKSGIIIGIKH